MDADTYASMAATATVYAIKPELEIEYKYDSNGLHVQKIVTYASGVTTTDYTLHGNTH